MHKEHSGPRRDSINNDMDRMARGDVEAEPAGGANALVLIGSRRLSTELGDLAETVNNRAPYNFKFDYQFDKNGDPLNAYCRSDHYMYARYGIPVTFFSADAWYRDYHMVSDEPQYVAYNRMTKIGEYIRDQVNEVAKHSHTPLVDKPRPDPYATYKQ